MTHLVSRGESLPADNPGEVSQVYGARGTLLQESDRGLVRLLDVRQVADASGTARSFDRGRMFPPAAHPYRVRYATVETPHGTVVVATAISRRKHDEALRELLLQLGIADLATILAAGLVGWATTRAALGPVERYRRAAAAAEGDPSRRLPIDEGHDDELTRLGTTFNALLEEIEEGQLRERQFLADASHELRSPLALMAAEVEWSRHRPRAVEELNQVLTSLGEQTQRLIGLANSLLDLEEAKGAPVTRDSVPLDRLVEAAVAVPRELAGEDREIVVRAPGTAVSVDLRWMELAVANLVTNAIKHGAGVVSVVADVEENRLRIRVTDEGGGIPEELGVKAFDRFARGDESRSTPGNGLGLALVQAVAQAHGGSAALVPGGVEMLLPHSVVDL